MESDLLLDKENTPVKVTPSKSWIPAVSPKEWLDQARPDEAPTVPTPVIDSHAVMTPLKYDFLSRMSLTNVQAEPESRFLLGVSRCN